MKNIFKNYFEDIWDDKFIRRIVIGIALLILAVIGTTFILLGLSFFR